MASFRDSTLPDPKPQTASFGELVQARLKAFNSTHTTRVPKIVFFRGTHFPGSRPQSSPSAGPSGAGFVSVIAKTIREVIGLEIVKTQNRSKSEASIPKSRRVWFTTLHDKTPKVPALANGRSLSFDTIELRTIVDL